MQWTALELPPIGTNAYLLADLERKEAALFDAPLSAASEVDRLLQRDGLELQAVLLTHGHWDHILDVPEYNRRGVPVYIHKLDLHFIEEPEKMAAYTLPGVDLAPSHADGFLAEGQPLELLGRSFEVREVPGHCRGSVLFYLAEEGVCVCGDAIFQGSIGRTDLPDGDFATLERSIKEKIYTLPDDTRLLPGHGPPTTVGHEKQTNPYVR